MSTAVAAQQTIETNDWKSSLPENIRNDASLKDVKDVGSLADQFINAQKLIGGSVRRPKPEADQKEWDTYYAKLGRPDQPEMYQVKRPAMPDGVAYDEDFEKWVKASGHAAGLDNNQIQRLVDEHGKRITVKTADANKAEEAEANGAVETLKKDWGGSYERNVDLAKGLITKYGSDALKAEFNKLRTGNSPELIRFLVTIGNKLAAAYKEDEYVEGRTVTMSDEKAALEKENLELLKGPLASRAQGREYQNAVQRQTAIKARLEEIEGQ